MHCAFIYTYINFMSQTKCTLNSTTMCKFTSFFRENTHMPFWNLIQIALDFSGKMESFLFFADFGQWRFRLKSLPQHPILLKMMEKSQRT